VSSRIKSICAREVFSARGHPGIETVVRTEDGSEGRAEVTAGLSVGKYEVKFVYDGEKRFGGLGLRRAVEIVNAIIAPKLIGMDATQQRALDDLMIRLDGTSDRSKLGGNATASVSAAALKAGAASLGVPLYQHIGGVNACILPVPDGGAFSGSQRYGGGSPGAMTGDKPSHEFVCYGFHAFSDATYAAWEVQQEFQRFLKKKFGSGTPLNISDCTHHDRELWDGMTAAIESAGYRGKVGIQIDVAAGTYYDETKGKFVGLFSRQEKTREELIELYKEAVKTYPVVILEDPLDEDDFAGHALLAKELGIEVVGDDLFTTNSTRLQMGIEVGAANAMLLKVNQVGTISEAFDAVQLAYRHGYGVMPCASRGEGAAIADYVVGLSTGHMRGGGGGPSSNRLLEIEAELGSAAKFLGKAALKGA
jgi:enolase